MKWSRILAAIWLLGGCASTPPADDIAASWQGRDINDLIYSWGPPTGIYELPDRRKLLTYTYTGASLAATNPFAAIGHVLQSTAAGMRGYPAPLPPPSPRCKVTFRTDAADLIVSHDITGGSGCNAALAEKPQAF